MTHVDIILVLELLHMLGSHESYMASWLISAKPMQVNKAIKVYSVEVTIFELICLEDLWQLDNDSEDSRDVAEMYCRWLQRCSRDADVPQNWWFSC